MKAEFLSEQEYPLWDAFVEQHPLGLVYHLSSWKEMLERAFSHIKGYFLTLRDSSGTIAAGIPIYLVRSRLLGNRLVSIPYASISDPLIASAEHYQELLQALIAFQKETHSKSVSIKTLKTDQWIDSSSHSAPQALHHYLLLDKPLNEIKKQFSRKATQYMVDRAQRQGLTVTREYGQASLQIIHEFMVCTRRRLCLPPTPYKYFEAFFQSFQENRRVILTASLDQVPVAALLALNFHGVLHIENYGGNEMAYRMGASHLLHWEAIRHAADLGCAAVSFGLTDSWNEGLIRFKKHWATIEEPIGISMISPNSSLSKPGKSVKNSKISRLIFGHAPQPVCEVLASLIYRHHG